MSKKYLRCIACSTKLKHRYIFDYLNYKGQECTNFHTFDPKQSHYTIYYNQNKYEINLSYIGYDIYCEDKTFNIIKIKKDFSKELIYTGPIIKYNDLSLDILDRIEENNIFI